MTDKVINCYELDIKQDISVEMELLRLSNKELKGSNRNFRITLLTVGLVIILFAVYQSLKTRIEEKEKY